MRLQLFIVTTTLAIFSFLRTAPVARENVGRYLRATDAFNERSACWRNGSWVYKPTRRPLLTSHFGDVGHNSAFCQSNNPEARSASLKWVWQPLNDACTLTDPTPEEFCLLLGGKNVLIVGDSLNYELFETIVDFIGPPIPVSRSQFTEPESFVCNGTSRVKFVRNDILSTASEDDIGPDRMDRANFYESPWVQYLLSDLWPIVVMNRGAHYVADALLRQGLRETIAFLSRNLRRGVLIYRNTASGHKCSSHLTAPESGHNDQAHNWAEFSRQNGIAERYFSRLGAHLIDVHSLMLDRPDWHLNPPIDCLHYCIPGPIDNWMVLVYNVLQFIGHEKLRVI